jgi:hypothetical protein
MRGRLSPPTPAGHHQVHHTSCSRARQIAPASPSRARAHAHQGERPEAQPAGCPSQPRAARATGEGGPNSSGQAGGIGKRSAGQRDQRALHERPAPRSCGATGRAPVPDSSQRASAGAVDQDQYATVLQLELKCLLLDASTRDDGADAGPSLAAPSWPGS